MQSQRPECCVETVDLTHRFSEAEAALDRVNLRVAEGSIYGFLGPNGAGKTTTLKLILGLLKKQRGEVYVFGRPFTDDRVETLRRVGSMIESPSIYAHLTAAENLQVLRRVYGCPQRRVEEVLELVGLARAGRKRAGQFSLGMKQRLGLALALLHTPTLLVLDEPTNGLDPNGILEMRGLLRTLNRERGVTILVSSHLLSEVEKLVTHVGIINRGRLLFQGTLAELMDRRRESASVVFGTDDDAKAGLVIRGLGLSPSVGPEGVAVRGLAKERVAGVNRALVQSGVGVFQIGKVESDLEQIFLDMVGG